LQYQYADVQSEQSTVVLQHGARRKSRQNRPKEKVAGQTAGSTVERKQTCRRMIVRFITQSALLSCQMIQLNLLQFNISTNSHKLNDASCNLNSFNSE